MWLKVDIKIIFSENTNLLTIFNRLEGYLILGVI